jgi:hypothetical protein
VTVDCVSVSVSVSAEGTSGDYLSLSVSVSVSVCLWGLGTICSDLSDSGLPTVSGLPLYVSLIFTICIWMSVSGP